MQIFLASPPPREADTGPFSGIRESGCRADSGFTIFIPLYRGGGRASSPFPCYDCMKLHKLAGLQKPLGGTIKENLAHSPHFSSSSPISPSMHLPVFFSHMKYEASLIHSIQLIRQDGSAKARVKIQQYLLPLCRSGSNKKRGGGGAAVKEPFSRQRHWWKICQSYKHTAAVILLLQAGRKHPRIHINGFDWSRGRKLPADSLSGTSSCMCEDFPKICLDTCAEWRVRVFKWVWQRTRVCVCEPRVGKCRGEGRTG